MSRILRILCATLLVAFTVSLVAEPVFAKGRRASRSSGRKGRGPSCGSCSSGYGLVAPSGCGKGHSPKVQKMFEENRGAMVSCCRPQDGQDRLIKCYNDCGQPGRAARRSNHTLGLACDTRSSSVGKKYGLGLFPHHGSLHWSTTGR